MTDARAMPDFDIYAELGLSREATAAQIKSAYRRKAKEHHPDVATDKPAAEVRMKRINQARDVLLDGGRRAEYDRVWTAPGPRGGTSRSGQPGGSSSRSRASDATGSQAERDRRARAERERRARADAERRQREREAAARAAREAAARAERERRTREAAERADRERREREAAAQAARERRAQAAAERAARKRRARQLGGALLSDDTELLYQIHADGVVDWSRQRASARFQAERAVAKTRAIEELRTAVASDDAASVRVARRMAAAVGAEAQADLRVRSRGAYRTRPRRNPVPAGRSHREDAPRPAEAPPRASRPARPRRDPSEEIEDLVGALRACAQQEVWADAARAWMGLRAKWGDRVTGDVRALGEDAVRRWGASLAAEGET